VPACDGLGWHQKDRPQRPKDVPYYTALGKADMGDMKNIVQMLCDSIIKGYQLLTQPDKGLYKKK